MIFKTRIKRQINWLMYKHICNSVRNIENITKLNNMKHLLFQGKHNHSSLKCHEFKSHDRTAWKVLFFGTDEFAVETLKLLNDNRLAKQNSVVDKLEVVCIKGKSIVRNYATQSSLKIHDWPITIEEGRFDVGVLASFGHLIPSSLIKKFPFGILNVHPSLLPRWRGAAPIIHTILNGDTVTGISIMQIKPKRFDIGPVLVQKEVVVPDRSTSISLCKYLAVLGGEILVNCLQDLPNIVKQEKPQDRFIVSQAPKLSKKMAEINWNKSCVEIDQQYRAVGPLFTLYTIWKNKRLKLLNMVDYKKTQNIVLEKIDKLPLRTVRFHWKEKIIIIKCKDGFVGFKNVVYQRPLTALEFYNGFVSKTTEKYIVLDCASNAKNSLF